MSRLLGRCEEVRTHPTRSCTRHTVIVSHQLLAAELRAALAVARNGGDHGFCVIGDGRERALHALGLGEQYSTLVETHRTCEGA